MNNTTLGCFQPSGVAWPGFPDFIGAIDCQGLSLKVHVKLLGCLKVGFADGKDFTGIFVQASPFDVAESCAVGFKELMRLVVWQFLDSILA